MFLQILHLALNGVEVLVSTLFCMGMFLVTLSASALLVQWRERQGPSRLFGRFAAIVIVDSEHRLNFPALHYIASACKVGLSKVKVANFGEVEPLIDVLQSSDVGSGNYHIEAHERVKQWTQEGEYSAAISLVEAVVHQKVIRSGDNVYREFILLEGKAIVYIWGSSGEWIESFEAKVDDNLACPEFWARKLRSVLPGLEEVDRNRFPSMQLARE